MQTEHRTEVSPAGRSAAASHDASPQESQYGVHSSLPKGKPRSTPRQRAHGRGRDEDCSSPPAQIRTCGFPASGSCLRSNVIGLRGMGYPCSSDPWARCVGDMLGPALCPEHALQLTLRLTGRLPSAVSAADVTRHCSRLTGTMQPSDSSSACMPIVRLLPSWAGPAFWPDADEVSQVPCKGCLHVRGVSDSARLLVRKPFARGGCCFPANRTASAPRNSTRFAAQYPARGLPCERFKLSLAASPCITRGRGGWLGLTPWKTCTSYPLPACPGALSLGHSRHGRSVRFQSGDVLVALRDWDFVPGTDQMVSFMWSRRSASRRLRC